MSGGWIGVDLDGTLAIYDHWRGPNHIGAPIEAMVRRVKAWIASGRDVRIVTARVHPENPDCFFSQCRIEGWCEVTIGMKLPVTYCKDFGMVELWDDRAVQVILNTGQRADGKES